MSAKRRRVVVVASVAAIALLVVLVGLPGRGDAGDAVVAHGTIEATEAHLGFQAAGRIDSIQVREGDPVRAGAVLASLDRREPMARRDQAEAQVAVARALLRELEHGSRSEEVAQARAARDAAQERLSDAERDLTRAKRLYDGGAISLEAYEKAVVAHEVGVDQFAQAAEQVKLLEAGPRPERIEAQRAQLAQARAALRAIEVTLDNMTLTAPFDGVVTVRHREKGETVGAGAPVLTIMNPNDRWVRIYVREDRIGTVKLGTSASITTDTYPDRSYAGEVIFIASEAEFTPKSVQTTAERVKLVYAVKVRIADDTAFDLRPGVPADVRLGQEES